MRQLWRLILTVGVVGAMAGCDWEGTDEDEAWNDGQYSLFNFSGNYRGVNGYLVSKYTMASVASTTGSNGTTSTSFRQTVQDEAGGTASAFTLILSGTIRNTPIEAGSVRISLGGVGNFTDSGGILTGSYVFGGVVVYAGTGTINYNTGAWSLTLASPGLDVAQSILITYVWGTTTTVTSNSTPATTTTATAPHGSTLYKIYAFLVEQEGNRVRLTDSRGMVYEGKMGSVTFTADKNKIEPQQTAGTGGGTATATTQEGEVIAQFSVDGTSAAGLKVTIVGTFQGYYTAATRMTGRIINGSWIEHGGVTGDIRGSADVAASN